MICPHCGRESDPLFKFCLHCGKELGPAKKAPPRKAEEKKPEVPAARPAPPAAAAAVKAAAKPAPAPASAPASAPEGAPEPEPEAAPAPQAARKAARKAAVAEDDVEAPPAPARASAPAGEVSSSVRCPRCRAKLTAGATACGLCGFQLAGAPAAPAKADEARPAKTTSEISPRKKAVGYLIAVSSVDGRETLKMPIKEGLNTLGRTNCDILFPEDDLLSPTHVVLKIEGSKASLECRNSRNGTFIRMTDQVKLEHGDQFRVGQQLLRFEDLSRLEPVVAATSDGTQVLGSPAGPRAWGRLTQVVGEHLDGASFLLTSENVFLGRERGNITFPGDRYISGTHAVVTRKSDGIYLRDVGSSNGTYFRLKDETEMTSGQYFLAGRQLFKLNLGA
jgi:pSer/pThr/pTyr-binding forkhead associated (FHA) protein